MSERERTDGVDELERLMFEARRARRPVRPGEGWTERVMADIRLAGPGGDEPAFLELAAGYAWRLSAAAGCAALALLVYVAVNGFVDYQELALSFLENPWGFAI